MVRIGFREARKRAIEALRTGNYSIAARNNIDAGNLLATGDVSKDEIIEVLKACTGNDHERRPHHMIRGIDVHIVKSAGWYIKFYFIDPDTFFLSVHR